MDDVLEGLADAWVKYLNLRHGTTVTYDDVTDWNLDKAFPELTKEEVYAPLRERELWETVKPLPGAVEYLKKLIDDGHDVYIVTATNYYTVRDKMELVLFKYFPYINWNHVIIAQKKQMIHGDIMLDDNPNNLIGGKYMGILMTACHNKKFNAKAAGFARADNWAEAYKAIKRYELVRKIIRQTMKDVEISEDNENDNTIQCGMPEVLRPEKET